MMVHIFTCICFKLFFLSGLPTSKWLILRLSTFGNCQHLVDYNVSLTTCIVLACPAPPNSTHAFYESKAQYTAGVDVTYVCEDNYFLASGDLSRTCQQNGQWNGVLPQCNKNVCGPPDNGTHAFYTSDGETEYSPGATLTYACEDGYSFVSGDLQWTCRDESVWDGTLPLCSQNTCSPPANGSHAYYSSNSQSQYDSGFTLSYTCDDTYSLASGDLSRTCQNNGQWDGTVPECRSKYI